MLIDFENIKLYWDQIILYFILNNHCTLPNELMQCSTVNSHYQQQQIIEDFTWEVVWKKGRRKRRREQRKNEGLKTTSANELVRKTVFLAIFLLSWRIITFWRVLKQVIIMLLNHNFLEFLQFIPKIEW